jgi:hypothetical protein
MDVLAGRPDHLDRLVDLLLLGLVELFEVLLDTADELTQPLDLLIGGHGLGPGPVIEFVRGADAFSTSQ